MTNYSTVGNNVNGDDVTVIPGTYVYYLPYGGYDCYFYGGYWYHPWNGYWYRSYGYNSGWYPVNQSYVPYSIVNLPGNWRARVMNSPRIGWGNVRANWQYWQNSRYWGTRNWVPEPRYQLRANYRGINNARNTYYRNYNRVNNRYYNQNNGRNNLNNGRNNNNQNYYRNNNNNNNNNINNNNNYRNNQGNSGQRMR